MVHVTDLIRPGMISPEGFRFKPQFRREQSRTGGGSTLLKDFGTPLWVADYTTVIMRNADALALEARLNRIEDTMGTFRAHDVRQPFPRHHADGVFDDTGKIASISSDRSKISLYNLPAGMQLSEGDYLSFQATGWASLHQFGRDVTADEHGVTVQFEIVPHLWFSVVADTPVVLKRPYTVMQLLPNSIASTPAGPLDSLVSFQGIQVPFAGE